MTFQNKRSADIINFEPVSADKYANFFRKETTRQKIEDYIEARRLRENLCDVFTHLLEVNKDELDDELAKWLD